MPLTFLNWAQTKSSSRAGLEKVWAVTVDRISPVIPRSSQHRQLTHEAFWPSTLDKESDRAARILLSFCRDGFCTYGAEAQDDGLAQSEGVADHGPIKLSDRELSLRTVPYEAVKQAAGVAVFTAVRTDLWVSGAGGSGILIARLPDGQWGCPSALMLNASALDFGIGTDIFDCLLIINSREALESLMHVPCTLGGQLNAVTGPLTIGKNCNVDPCELDPPAAVWKYIKTRGSLVERDTQSLIFNDRSHENERCYGTGASVTQILTERGTPTPPSFQSLIAALKTVQGDLHVDESLLPSAEERTPGDFRPEQDDLSGRDSPAATMTSTSVSMNGSSSFGLPPTEDDSDPFGVRALQQQGMEVREAGTRRRPSVDAFEYRPSISSPIYANFHPGRSSRRGSSSRLSVTSSNTDRLAHSSHLDSVTSTPDLSNQTTDHETLTPASTRRLENASKNSTQYLDMPRSAGYRRSETAGSPLSRRADSSSFAINHSQDGIDTTIVRRASLPQSSILRSVNSLNHFPPRHSDASTSPQILEATQIIEDVAAEESLDTDSHPVGTQPVVHRAKLVTIPKRIPLPLPMRNPKRQTSPAVAHFNVAASIVPSSPLVNEQMQGGLGIKVEPVTPDEATQFTSQHVFARNSLNDRIERQIHLAPSPARRPRPTSTRTNTGTVSISGSEYSRGLTTPPIEVDQSSRFETGGLNSSSNSTAVASSNDASSTVAQSAQYISVTDQVLENLHQSTTVIKDTRVEDVGDRTQVSASQKLVDASYFPMIDPGRKPNVQAIEISYDDLQLSPSTSPVVSPDIKELNLESYPDGKLLAHVHTEVPSTQVSSTAGDTPPTTMTNSNSTNVDEIDAEICSKPLQAIGAQREIRQADASTNQSGIDKADPASHLKPAMLVNDPDNKGDDDCQQENFQTKSAEPEELKMVDDVEEIIMLGENKSTDSAIRDEQELLTKETCIDAEVIATDDLRALSPMAANIQHHEAGPDEIQIKSPEQEHSLHLLLNDDTQGATTTEVVLNPSHTQVNVVNDSSGHSRQLESELLKSPQKRLLPSNPALDATESTTKTAGKSSSLVNSGESESESDLSDSFQSLSGSPRSSDAFVAEAIPVPVFRHFSASIANEAPIAPYIDAEDDSVPVEVPSNSKNNSNNTDEIKEAITINGIEQSISTSKLPPPNMIDHNPERPKEDMAEQTDLESTPSIDGLNVISNLDFPSGQKTLVNADTRIQDFGTLESELVDLTTIASKDLALDEKMTDFEVNFDGPSEEGKTQELSRQSDAASAPLVSNPTVSLFVPVVPDQSPTISPATAADQSCIVAQNVVADQSREVAPDITTDQAPTISIELPEANQDSSDAPVSECASELLKDEKCESKNPDDLGLPQAIGDAEETSAMPIKSQTMDESISSSQEANEPSLTEPAPIVASKPEEKSRNAKRPIRAITPATTPRRYGDNSNSPSTASSRSATPSASPSKAKAGSSPLKRTDPLTPSPSKTPSSSSANSQRVRSAIAMFEVNKHATATKNAQAILKTTRAAAKAKATTAGANTTTDGV